MAGEKARHGRGRGRRITTAAWQGRGNLPARPNHNQHKRGATMAEQDLSTLAKDGKANKRGSMEGNAIDIIDMYVERIRYGIVQAKNAQHDLLKIVNNYAKSIALEEPRYDSPRCLLMGKLHDTCSMSFDALSRQADTIECAVKAMRILAVDMPSEVVEEPERGFVATIVKRLGITERGAGGRKEP